VARRSRRRTSSRPGCCCRSLGNPCRTLIARRSLVYHRGRPYASWVRMTVSIQRRSQSARFTFGTHGCPRGRPPRRCAYAGDCRGAGSKLNDSFGLDSGASRPDSGTPASRPFEASKAVARYVRNTSKPIVHCPQFDARLAAANAKRGSTRRSSAYGSVIPGHSGPPA
jgi:hypothetical protein